VRKSHGPQQFQDIGGGFEKEFEAAGKNVEADGPINQQKACVKCMITGSAKEVGPVTKKQQSSQVTKRRRPGKKQKKREVAERSRASKKKTDKTGR
jgi:hypothetical protein